MIEGTSYLIDTSNTQIMGIIKSVETGTTYDHNLHKSEYDRLSDFVLQYV